VSVAKKSRPEDISRQMTACQKSAVVGGTGAMPWQVAHRREQSEWSGKRLVASSHAVWIYELDARKPRARDGAASCHALAGNEARHAKQ